EQAHAGDGREDPSEFGDFRHVRLAVEGRFLWIEAEGQGIDGDIADVFTQDVGRGPRLSLRFLGLLHVLAHRLPEGGQRVVICDEIEALALVLKSNVLLDGPEVVADVQLPGRLNAGQDSLASLAGHGFTSKVTSEE